MHQTPFQRLLWIAAKEAHAAGDRSDARILMRMIEGIDEGDYELTVQLSQALRQGYRERIGRVPGQRAQDVTQASGSQPHGTFPTPGSG